MVVRGGPVVGNGRQLEPFERGLAQPASMVSATVRVPTETPPRMALVISSADARSASLAPPSKITYFC